MAVAGIELMLVSAAGYLALDIARQIVLNPFAPAAAFAAQDLPRTTHRAARTARDYDVICEKDIFNAPKKELVVSAPPLPPPNVKFVGSASSEDRSRGWVALEDLSSRQADGRQAIYRVGDWVQNWIVAKIERNRVTLSNGAEERVLTAAFTREAALRWVGGTVKQKEPVRDRTYPLRPFMARLRLEDASSRGFLQAEAVYQAGDLLGLQMLGVKKGSALERIGVKDGDVVTTINGFSVSDPAEASVLLSKISGSGSSKIVVLRGEDSIHLGV